MRWTAEITLSLPVPVSVVRLLVVLYTCAASVVRTRQYSVCYMVGGAIPAATGRQVP